MPLSAVNFVPGTGPIKAADIKQFFDLFTGAMTDQPVTFANTFTVGGSQGVGSALLRLVGVALQTGNMLEARAVAADAQPIFSISAAGAIGIGPGGGVNVDTTLARTGVSRGTFTGRLTVTPVGADIGIIVTAGGLQVTAGNIGVGIAPQSQVGIRITGSLVASGGSALGAYYTPNLTAAAAGDSLVGMQIQPTFTRGAFATITATGLRVTSPTGGGVDNFGIYIDPASGGSGVNISLYNGGTSALIGAVQLGNTAGTAVAGAMRLLNNNLIAWRNAAGNDDVSVYVDGTDRFGLTISSTQALLAFANPTSGTAGLSIMRHGGVSAALQQVTLGAADSGGAGFKLLRVPN